MFKEIVKKKRVSLDLAEFYAQEVKLRAAKKRVSMKEWIMEAIVAKIVQENLAKEE